MKYLICILTALQFAGTVAALRFTPRLVAHRNFKSTERWHGCVVRAVTAVNMDLIAE